MKDTVTTGPAIIARALASMESQLKEALHAAVDDVLDGVAEMSAAMRDRVAELEAHVEKLAARIAELEKRP